MSTIYRHTDEYNSDAVIKRMGDLDAKLEEEAHKSAEERSRSREFELFYARFLQGLRLCTGFGHI
ncbi:MAG: hypothetical protein LUD72_04150 [Bacteroidales bacterium]|nr:hypothetical protein [Bacteroidales bacterium]